MAPLARHVLLWIVLAGLVAATIEASRREAAWGGVTKVAASIVFLLMAWQARPWDAWGVAVAAGLLLSALGDGLLIGRGRWFLAGLGVFLLAHVAYAAGFVMHGGPWWGLAGMAVLALLAAAIVGPRIVAAAPRPMRGPVVAYFVAIVAMVATSGLLTGRPLIPLAAAMFAASDVFVARQRFVHPSWWNRAIGLPLYYAAQAILASSL